MNSYDIIVIGAGHAGCEAALVCAKMGCNVLLLTMNLDTIAKMSCNPAIGGIAKGQLVREIDALGGIMGKIIDKTAIQFKLLNTGKGPAVQSPRAQADKNKYMELMKDVLVNQNGLTIRQAEVEKIVVENNKVQGVITQTEVFFESKAVIITTGTFLDGIIHIGLKKMIGGRLGELSSNELSNNLKNLGFELKKLKTGTSARINKSSVDFKEMKVQDGDEIPTPFSFSTKQIKRKQIPCYITYTNEKTHLIIKKNLDKSPLYTGQITGTGVRYCPSIEDKIIKFADKESHQIFLEPEGKNNNEIYLNGLSTSLPENIQLSFIRTIKGLKNAEILRPGYAIEYNFALPTQLKPNLETKLVKNLFFAGQINGTTGYEEAAAQGLIAGINAVLLIKKQEPFILRRDEAYIGVLIDDLITKGTLEPYRMFTSLAEYRLLLRYDNADLRLMKYGYKYGLITKNQFDKLTKYEKAIEKEIFRLNNIKNNENISLAQLLKRPGINYETIGKKSLDEKIKQQVEINIKYEGYIKRQLQEIEKIKKLEAKKIPEHFDYLKIKGLSKEALEKLSRLKPVTLGQASRISGISPADILVLSIYLVRN